MRAYDMYTIKAYFENGLFVDLPGVWYTVEEATTRAKMALEKKSHYAKCVIVHWIAKSQNEVRTRIRKGYSFGVVGTGEVRR